MANENIPRCPWCGNILAEDTNGVLYCASCKKLLQSYCRENGLEYDIVRRVFCDKDEHIVWKWKNQYERDVYFLGKKDLGKKFRTSLGLS